jgi:diguanylate cyclase (GGDEF)-like protein/PAS domain S-box-containing protein
MFPLPAMQAVLDLLPDAVFCVVRGGLILSQVNRAACDSLGYTREELQGMVLGDICPPQDVMALAARLDGAAEGEPVIAIVRTVQRNKSGVATPAEWHVSQVRHPAGEYWIVVARTLPADGAAEISQAPPAESYGLGLPGHDPLTSLPDRRLFDRRLARAVERLRRHEAVGQTFLSAEGHVADEADKNVRPTVAKNDGYRFAVCFIDLDGFKTVNDTFGHLAGDRVLCEIARRLIGCIRAGDMAARYGGDEFTVFLDDVASEADAAIIARRILDRLQVPMTIDGREVRVAASVGVALSGPCGAGVSPARAAGTATPQDGRQARELLQWADRAMYRAKSLGGGQWAVFDKDI